MASGPGTASFSELGFLPFPSFAVRPRSRAFPSANSGSICVVSCCLGKSNKILKQQNPIFFAATPRKNREFMSHRSLELEQFVTSDDEDEMGDGFFEAIEELERMAREPSDILEEMNDRLSARELQLVLVYFSQEGRDSWCALEVFEWLKKENRVDKETMELMVAIMCGWMRKLIEGEHEVNDVADLLVDMDCVGLKPGFSMFEKVICLYWEMEKKEKAVSFVKEVLRRGTMNSEDNDEGHKGGPTGYLAWKMMVNSSYPELFINSNFVDTLMALPFLSKLELVPTSSS